MKIIAKAFIISAIIYSVACSEAVKKEEPASGKELSKTSSPAETSKSELSISDLKDTSSSGITPEAQTPVIKSSVALNPAHGEPGHDCAIPVGQPLNSSLQNIAPVSQQQASSPNTNTLSSPVLTNPSSNSGSQKLNPAHGMPGHDCAIPVGAPLNK